MSRQLYIDFLDDPRPGRQPGDLDEHETWWAGRQEALEVAGYMLRPRYRPGWIPSWRGTDKSYLDVEDGQGLSMRLGIDATRISDGRPVVLKRHLLEEAPYELQINRLFSTEPLASNPRNHCVRLLDVIQLPDDQPIMVHPLLRPHYDPPIRTIGEFVTFFAQISNRKKSKDFRRKAKGYSRTRRPTRYHLIDFGHSRFYDPANGPPLDQPLPGGDKSAPEHRDGKTPCNPFPTDVYYLGNLVRKDYMQRYHGLEFMQPLVADMVHEDPTRRPNMDEVVTRFADIRNKLSTWKLRSRIARNTEIWIVTAWRSVAHWYRTTGYVLARKAAIPEPK